MNGELKSRDVQFKTASVLALLMLASLPQFSRAALLDNTFWPGSGPNGTVYAVAVDGDKVIIGGSFTTYNGSAATNIARINADGSLDTSFQGTASGAVNAIALQTISGNIKILIGGQFTSVRRLNANGSTDSSFYVPTLNHYCTCIALDTGGGNNRIVIGGEFTSVNGTGRPRVARLNYDGSLDTYFSPYYGANSTVYGIAADAENRVLVGGTFTTLVTSSCNRIGRLSSSGSFDSSFTSSANDTVYVVAQKGVQNAGDYRVLTGGAFTNLSGSTRDGVGRLDVWGGAYSWSCTGANAQVLSGIVTSSEFIVGGHFTEMNGVERLRVARLTDTDGCVTSWNPAITGGGVYAMCLYQYGGANKLIVAGAFTTVEGWNYTRIARLNL